ncbi:MAG: glycosyltransferase family 4 protein [Magnetococcales bacterium]|nr:glycosyltransferase family 4 protein [Magnetococcales bacterium]
MASNNKRGILFIAENLPVPLHRRIWNEAVTLAEAGWPVMVICPRTRAFPASYEFLEGVHVYRHPMPLEAKGIPGFVLEYGSALFWETWLAWRIYFRHGFSVIQISNPPDWLFLVAVPFKWLRGVRLVFDHHDPFPELFTVKFPRQTGLQRLTLLAERLTFRAADRVVTTSAALQRLALQRGKVDPRHITLVRSGLDLSQHLDVPPVPALKEGRPHLVLYLGIIGSQDGVDHLLAAAHYLIHVQGRRDTLFLVVGDGTALAELKETARALGLEEHVRFTGYLTGTPLYQALATADVGVCPDPWNVFNDKLSMHKILEYMAWGIPILMYPLTENTLLAGEAALAADGNDPLALGRGLAMLLDDPERRQRMTAIGRERSKLFAWQTQVGGYLRVFDELTQADG